MNKNDDYFYMEKMLQNIFDFCNSNKNLNYSRLRRVRD